MGTSLATNYAYLCRVKFNMILCVRIILWENYVEYRWSNNWRLWISPLLASLVYSVYRKY